MREVAAEAGVSLRLVQYYFGTKEELLLAAMQYLAARFGARAVARFRAASGSGGQASPRDIIAAILTEGLPADEERRSFTIIYTAYLALSLTDPALAIAPLVKNSGAVIDVVAAQLRAAQTVGDMPAHLDPDLEAVTLLTMSAGLGTSVLVGHSSVEQAQAVIDYHLYRLFPASRPALHRPLPWGPAGDQSRSSPSMRASSARSAGPRRPKTRPASVPRAARISAMMPAPCSVTSTRVARRSPGSARRRTRSRASSASTTSVVVRGAICSCSESSDNRIVPCLLSARSARRCAGVMSHGASVSADFSRSSRATAQKASESDSSPAGSVPRRSGASGRAAPSRSEVTGISYPNFLLYPHIEVTS
jgi:AcrR family transcriptional regulator